MRTKLISTLILLVVLFTGCNKAGIDSLELGSEASLGISVALDELSTRGVVPGISFGDGVAIDVVLKNDNTSELDYKGIDGNGLKRKFTFNTTNSTWGIDTGCILTSQRGVVAAFYPSGLVAPVLTADIKTLTPAVVASTSIDLTSVPSVDLDGTTRVKLATSEIDYMIGKGTSVSQSVSMSTVTMNHVMAMVAVELTTDKSYSGNGLLTQVKFENASAGNEILLGGSVDVATGSFNESSTAVTYTRTLTNYAVGDQVALLACPAILYEDGLVKLTLMVDGKSYDIKLQGTLDGSRSWEAGKCILYKVKISGTKLILTSVSITPWKSSNVINQNVKSDYPEKNATLTLSEKVPATDIPATGSTYKIKVTSNADWMAVATNCTVSPASGTGTEKEQEVTITVEQDLDGMKREVKVEFYTQLVGGANLSESWTGTQAKGNTQINIPEVFELLGEADSYSLSIKGNTGWTAVGTNCTLTTTSGSEGSSSVQFSVEAFMTGVREASITLTSTIDPSYSITWRTIQTNLEVMKIGDLYWLAKNMEGTQGQISDYGLVAQMENPGSFFKWGSKYVYDRTSTAVPLDWGNELTGAAITPTASSIGNAGYDYASLNSTEISGVAGDPCSALGANFKTPTAAQWKTLEALNGVFVTIKSQTGMLYGETTFIKPDTTFLKFPNGCIFFPAGGYRSYADGTPTLGVGSYITSSAKDDKNNQGYTFTNGGVVNYDAVIPRGSGQSLRCVYKLP